jgi:hypothetical protein
MSFDETYLFNQLSNLTSSQKNIKNLSNYILNSFDRYNNQIISIINNQIDHSFPQNKTSILFLLNEIIILSILNNKLYVISSFEPSISLLIHNIILKSEDIKSLLIVKELIQIWSNKLIFSNEYLNPLLLDVERKINKVRHNYMLYNLL